MKATCQFSTKLTGLIKNTKREWNIIYNTPSKQRWERMERMFCSLSNINKISAETYFKGCWLHNELGYEACLFLHSCILGYLLCKGHFLAVTAVFVICRRNINVCSTHYIIAKQLRSMSMCFNKTTKKHESGLQKAPVLIVFGQSLKVINRNVAAAVMRIWNKLNVRLENREYGRFTFQSCVQEGLKLVMQVYFKAVP